MMKKSILFVLILLSFQFNHSQENKFGIIGGGNYSKLAGDFANRFNQESRLAYHFGGFLEFSLKEKISFSPRVIYSSQGYISTFDSTEGGFFFDPPQIVKSSNRYNYLNIPLLMRFYFTDKFGINIGPQVGFLLNRAVVLKEVEGTDNVEEGDRDSLSGDFKLDYGAKGGLFYNFSDRTFAELNYFRGFSNISRGGIGNITNDNSVFQLSLGYVLF